MAFSFEETQILLRTPRVGPQVIRRLEAVGLDSVAKLKTVGIEEAVGRVCTLVGSTAWRNRQRPLASALAVRISEERDRPFRHRDRRIRERDRSFR